MTRYTKDPDATITYSIDWSHFLASGETISDSTWIVPAGVTEESSSNTTTAASILLSGGTAGESYELINRITTSAGQIDDESIMIDVGPPFSSGTSGGGGGGGLLAKLTDLKADLHISGDDADAELTRLLADASMLAAQLAGVDTLARTSTTLYPFDPTSGGGGQTRIMRLHRPIESISSIKQRYDQSTAWADVDALTEDTDYLIVTDGGKVARINAVWYLGRRQLVQVTGVFGYDNPDDPVGGDGILPGADLQRAVRLQAIRAYQSDRNAGVREVDFGGDGGRLSFAETKPHPALIAAVGALPFRSVGI